MKKIIEDIKVYSRGSVIRVIATILINSNFQCVLSYRIANYFYKIHLPPISKVIHYLSKILYSIDIDYRADIAGGFMLIHGIGTVIGLDVKTDGPVKVYQGVTLGGNNGKERIVNGRKFSQPWLMADSTVYANATVIGPVIIGIGSVVGANSILTKDVPDGKTAYTKTDICFF